jgi:hypothetical protein
VLSSPHSADIGQGRRGKGGAGRLTHPLKLDRCMLKSQTVIDLEGALHKNSRFLVKGQSFRSGKNYSRELPAPIHNRTPVILPATAWRLWFGEEKRSPTNPSASSDYVQRN